MQPDIELAARHAKGLASDGRIELLEMGFYEDVLQSEILRSPLIPHRPSHVSTTTPKVSVESREVHYYDN